MDEIIKRIEAATGPDKTLDADIWFEVYTPNAVAVPLGFEGPPYTASIDAAVALVPDQWAWFAQWIGEPFSEGSARVWVPSKRTLKLPVETFQVEAKTPALALCLTAMMARRVMLTAA